MTLEPDAEGIILSRVFLGLWLSVESLLVGNLAEVQRVLELGLATKEHATFVQQLAQG